MVILSDLACFSLYSYIDYIHLVVDVLLPGGDFLEGLADLLMEFVQVDFGVGEGGVDAVLVSVHLLIMCPPVLRIKHDGTFGWN